MAARYKLQHAAVNGVAGVPGIPARSMRALYTYLVAAGLGLGAIYSAILAYEWYPQAWKVVASALIALTLGALGYYLVASV